MFYFAYYYRMVRVRKHFFFCVRLLTNDGKVVLISYDIIRTKYKTEVLRPHIFSSLQFQKLIDSVSMAAHLAPFPPPLYIFPSTTSVVEIRVDRRFYHLLGSWPTAVSALLPAFRLLPPLFYLFRPSYSFPAADIFPLVSFC